MATPIVDLYPCTFKEVQPIPAVGALVLLYQDSQDVSALFFDAGHILMGGRQQFRIFHVCAPKKDSGPAP